MPSRGRQMFPTSVSTGTFTSDAIELIPPYNAVLVELNGNGSLTTVTILDSDNQSAGFNATQDTSQVPTGATTAYKKFLVVNTLSFVRVQLVVGSGQWNALVTPVVATNQSTVTINANASQNLNQVGSTAVVTAGVAGLLAVGGAVAAGSAVGASYPVMAGASDGTNVQRISSDTSGRLIVVGAAASGSAAAGNPVLIAGVNAGNAVQMSSDATGRPNINLNTFNGTSAVNGGVAGLMGVGGNVASGAADTANPVKIGGVFNTIQPTVTTGQRVDGQMTARGAQIVATGVDGFAVNLNQIAGTAIVTGGTAGTQAVGGIVASGAADTNVNPLLVGGDSAGSLVKLVCDSGGNLAVNVGKVGGNAVPTNVATGVLAVSTEGQKATYSASSIAISLAASATDVFGIQGSGTKTIRILRISVSGIATTAASTSVLLIARSTADGAFSNTLTAAKHDSNNAAATASVGNFTANPSLGTAAGTLRAEYMDFALTGVSANGIVWDFTTRNGQALTLRGTGQGVYVNLNGVTVTGGVISIDIEWTEE